MLRRFRRFTWLRVLLTLAGILTGLFLMVWVYTFHPKFGQLPTGNRLELIRRSPNYDGEGFRNAAPSTLFTGTKSRTANFFDFLFVKRPRLRPEEPLPAVKTNLKSLPRNQDIVVWLGHSSFFVQFGGKRLLIDPVFGTSAAPVDFVNRAFAGTNLYGATDMPDIDYLLITHDHWDHLDYPSVAALMPKVGRVITGLGVGAHFERWGYPAEKTIERDWFTSVNLGDNVTLHVLPARHFSGRLLTRNQTLWVAFALVTPERRIFFSGDSGYGTHFAKIGREFGGFDLVVLDTGQYDLSWAQVHMFPEETAKAAEDLGAKALLPAHIGRFCISNHTWDDPFYRIVAASENKKYRLLTPMIGTPVDLADETQRFPHWWENAAENKRTSPR